MQDNLSYFQDIVFVMLPDIVGEYRLWTVSVEKQIDEPVLADLSAAPARNWHIADQHPQDSPLRVIPLLSHPGAAPTKAFGISSIFPVFTLHVQLSARTP